MRWKEIIGGVLIFLGLLSYFFWVNPFLFAQQEEVQLFIPDGYLVCQQLSIPGGFCTLVGLFLTQFYTSLYAACLINAGLFFLLWGLFYLILQKILRSPFSLFVACIPVLFLLHMQQNPAFVLDGVVGFVLLLLFLYGSLCLADFKYGYWGVGLASFLIYYLFGQLIVLFAALFVLLAYLTRKNKWYAAFGILFLSGLLSYVGVRLGWYIPLTDGIYSLRYQESQLAPDSFLYYVWLRLTMLSALLFVLAAFLNWSISKWPRTVWLAYIVVFAGVVSAAIPLMPDAFDRQNRLFGELAYLQRKQDWDGVIRVAGSVKNPGSLVLNYLNWALAEKGVLADQLFFFDQRGAQSLIAPWNGTYYMSAFLSDLHYRIGDLSVSESYAMEALTLAKRGGSPRALQRLIDINLQKGDFPVAKKYIHLLLKTPVYNSWARKKSPYSAEEIEGEVRRIDLPTNDRLLSQLDTETLWLAHLKASPSNLFAFDYLACSYLLAKEVDKFKDLLAAYPPMKEDGVLPRHFQEAVLIGALENEADQTEVFPVTEQSKTEFAHFRDDFRREASHANGYATMSRLYGNTYWFYYYCKQL